MDHYIDLAVQRLGLPSDRALDEYLGLRSQVTRWRRGYGLPSPETMVQLAQAAGVDEEIALLHLHIWQLEDVSPRRGDAGARHDAIRAYESILKKLDKLDLIRRGGAAVILALAVFFGDGDGGAQAAQSANIAPPGHSSIYIMRQFRRWLARHLAALTGRLLASRHNFTGDCFA